MLDSRAGRQAFLIFPRRPKIFVTRLLGLGEQDFWVRFAPMIIGVVSGSWVVGRAADLMDRSPLITLGFLGTVATTTLNLLLVTVAPGVTGGFGWSLLFVMAGPTLIAFTVALLHAPIQLEIMDVFPQKRGATASLGTCSNMGLNALLAGIVAPLVMANLVSVALSALAFALLGAWHLSTVRRAHSSES